MEKERIVKPQSNRLRLLCSKVTQSLFASLFLSLLLISVTEAQVPPFKPCAQDPTYKYFEVLQYKAYTSDPKLQELLPNLQNMGRLMKEIKETGAQLDKRDNPLNVPNSDNPDTLDLIKRWVDNLKLPTCYENPLVYILLKQYAENIDKARQEMNRPMLSVVHIATLPTTEVNAYTYPATDSRDSVIAFNAQLFMFAYQMSKVTFPTLEVRNDQASGRIAVNTSKKKALELLNSNPDIVTNYVMAILEFLLLVPPSTEPISQSYDPLLISLTEGMEMFAVGHEYGHVVLNHKSPTMNIRLGADSLTTASVAPTTVPVLARSWKQELEADQEGIQLLIHFLKQKAKTSQVEDAKWVYTLKGALFFFECLDLIEQAKFIRDRGEVPVRYSLAERSYIRAFADGKNTPQQDALHSDLNLRDHPPAWLRLERVQDTIDKELTSHPASSSSEAVASIADGISDNAQLVWRMIMPRMPILMKALQLQTTHPDQPLNAGELLKLSSKIDDTNHTERIPPGCRVDVQAWADTFLCNPALQDAVVAFQSEEQPDSELLNRYQLAVRRDWRLSSGVQVRWAESTLIKGGPDNLQIPLAVLALAGDRQSLDVLSQIDPKSWSSDDRRVLVHAKQFLITHGRDTSAAALRIANPDSLVLTDLLCFPGGMEGGNEIAKNLPVETSNAAQGFLRTSGGAAVGRSLSPLVLSMLLERKSAGEVYSLLADVLLKGGYSEAALRYAETGLADGGPPASLENDIGNILSAKGNLQLANSHYLKSLEAGRQDGWPEINTAQNLADLGELDQAESWFRRGLKRQPRSEVDLAEYLNDFAWFLATHRKEDNTKLKEGLALSQLSNLMVKRANPNFLDTLAECQAANGSLDEAIKTEREALALIADDPTMKSKYVSRVTYFEGLKGQPNRP